MREYVGIPYQPRGMSRSGIDCWELVRLVYREKYNKHLPSFNRPFDLPADVEVLDAPVEGCIVRCFRAPPFAHHYGVYFAGYVLSADRPMSCIVDLSSFAKRFPVIEFMRAL